MVWNVDKDDNIDPPSQTKNFLSSDACTLTLTVGGTILSNYLFSLSGIPLNIVVPPLITILE